MSAITVGGDLVHYEVLGRGGRPVVLVHGWLGSWRYWIPTMRLLQLKFRVYAVDLFGFGDSSKNPVRYSLPHQVLLLDEFMKQLALPRAAMIGHGYGAQVITEYAFMHPQRVPRMMLASAPLFEVSGLESRQPLVERRVMLTDSMALKAKIAGAAPLADKSTLDPEKVEDSANQVSDPTIPSLSNRTLKGGAGIDREKLREVPVAQGLPIIPKPKDATEPNRPQKPSINPLPNILSNNMDALLAKCFRRSEPQFDKLHADVQRADNNVLQISAQEFDPGLMLDKIRLLEMPICAVHGLADPLIPAPDESVWNYLTESKEDKLLPVSLPDVRHFPMLESETFSRVLGQFLETPDISKIELKERWRRRAR